MCARRRRSLKHAPNDAVIAEVALAIAVELERCASLALRCLGPNLAPSGAAPSDATALAIENRRLRTRLRQLSTDKVILQLILKQKS
jgi:hypothetical protein